MHKINKIMLSVILSAAVLATPVSASSIGNSLVTTVKRASQSPYTWLAAGTAIGGALIYHFFFKLSDLEEIEQTLTLLENAQSSYHDATAAYYKPCSLFTKMQLDSVQDSTHNNALLKDLIAQQYESPSFYNYVYKSDATCECLQKHIDLIRKKKYALMERKSNVIKNTTKSTIEITEAVQHFNDVIEQCINALTDLKALHKAITTVREYVVTLNEYQKEYSAQRIAALEEEVAYLQRHCHCPYSHSTFGQMYYTH